MGLTPLAGICMGTRTGDIDPAIVPFLMQREGLEPEEIDTLLNKKSGVLGVSGVSSDFRDLAKAESEGNERAHLALEMFAYQGKKIIGSYAAAMGGVDVIVFTAGIGENTDTMRSAMCKDLEFLGVEFDEEKNAGLHQQAFFKGNSLRHPYKRGARYREGDRGARKELISSGVITGYKI